MRWRFVLLGALCHAAAHAQAPEGELILAPELEQKILSHVAAAKPIRPLAGFTAVEEIEHKANFGKKVYVDIHRQFLPLDNGLLASLNSSVFRSTDTQQSEGGSRGVGLCGLVGLVAEGGSKMENSVPFVARKLFLPNGLKTTVNSSSRVRLTAFEASVPSVCAPEPGSRFYYRTETEFTRRTAGVFTRTSAGREIVETICSVGLERQPASKLYPRLQGDYLAVSCESQTGDKKYRTDYAFLLDSAVYLMTQKSGEWQRSSLQYTEVLYAQP